MADEQSHWHQYTATIDHYINAGYDDYYGRDVYFWNYSSQFTYFLRS